VTATLNMLAKFVFGHSSLGRSGSGTGCVTLHMVLDIP